MLHQDIDFPRQDKKGIGRRLEDSTMVNIFYQKIARTTPGTQEHPQQAGDADGQEHQRAEEEQQ